MARIARRMKIGAFLHRRGLTAKKLAKAINIVLSSPAMKEKTKRLAKIMQEERGVENAIQHLEQG